MNTRNKLWQLLAVLLAFTVIAAACGSDDDETATSGDSADTTEAPAEEDDAMEDDAMEDDAMEDDEAMEDDAMDDAHAPISDECPAPNPAEEIEIDFMGWEFPVMSAYAEELEECGEGNYDINVQFLDSAEAQDAMRLDASTGSPEFEIYQGSNSFVIELANQGALMSLNDLIDQYGADYDLDQIDQSAFAPMSIDGEIYAIPLITNTMHLFYNEPVLADLGVAVPTTFDEAFEACAAIQAAGYDTGFQYHLAAGWSWRIEFDSVLGSLGVKPIDEATGQPNFNSPEGIEAANLLVRMNEECGGTTASTYSLDDMQAAFQTGELVLGHTWASRAAAMDDPEASTEVGNIAFAPGLSTGGSILASPGYSDGYGIPAGLDPEVAEAAFHAIMAAADLESQEAASAHGSVTRVGVIDPEGPRNAEAVATSLIEGKGPDLPTAAAAIARAKLGDALIQILDGLSVEAALAEAEAAYLEEAGAQGLIS